MMMISSLLVVVYVVRPMSDGFNGLPCGSLPSYVKFGSGIRSRGRVSLSFSERAPTATPMC